jgi:FMN phosphatase YigB (HAD superfamily)
MQANRGGAVASPTELVFMIDVDNTLLDNDRFFVELTARLDQLFGQAECQRYWRLYENRREALGYADYLGALQDFRLENNDEAGLLQASEFLLDYPFADLLYPDALAVVGHLGGMGTTIILSDGDIVFQPRKIRRSGLWDSLAGRVLVYVHKERMLDDIGQRFPAARYVMVDDKARLLAAMKLQLGDRLTTIFPRQGHYAVASAVADVAPVPDITVEHIGDLLGFSLQDLNLPKAGA